MIENRFYLQTKISIKIKLETRKNSQKTSLRQFSGEQFSWGQFSGGEWGENFSGGNFPGAFFPWVFFLEPQKNIKRSS